jgi:glycosyltransferase involved in cell wall biosynthesis
MSGTEKSPVDVSVVIPVFNEEANLPELYRRLSAFFNSISKTCEIVLVDDGSSDHSFEIMGKLSREDQRVVAVQFSRNFGQHPAIAAGLAQTSGKVVVIMDADLQNPPEEIAKLLAVIDQGYDLAFGIRAQRKDNLLRKIGSLLAESILKKLFGAGGNISAFMAVRQPFVQAFNDCPERNKFFTGLFTWLGAKSIGVEVEHSPRKSGQTHYSLRKLIQLLITMTVSFSEFPLRLASRIGFLVSIVGLVMAARVLIQKMFLQITVPGYASLFAAIVFFGGVQLLFLGIVGEYLARVHIESRRRPDYLIRNILRDGSSAEK